MPKKKYIVATIYECMQQDREAEACQLIAQLHPLEINIHWCGNTLLHFAVFYNQSLCLQALLAMTRVDVNQGDYRGKTPLFLACQKGNDADKASLPQ